MVLCISHPPQSAKLDRSFAHKDTLAGMIIQMLKNHLKALHLAWLSKSEVEDYSPDFKTLGYSLPAG